MNVIAIQGIEIGRDHDGRYCLNDLHRASGGEDKDRPGIWLQNQQTKDLVAEVEKDGIPSILSKQGLGTFVCKELVYAYAMWISPAFHLNVIRTFDAAVAAPQFQIPTTLAGALRLAAEQAEQLEQQAAALAVAAPKVAFVDRYASASNGSKGFREVCKLLGAKENEFRAFLIERGIMYRLGGKLVPYAPHLDAGRFEIKAGEVHEHAYSQTKFTAKGITWVAGEWGKRLVAA